MLRVHQPRSSIAENPKCEQKDAAELASAVSHMASQSRQPADLGRSLQRENLGHH